LASQNITAKTREVFAATILISPLFHLRWIANLVQKSIARRQWVAWATHNFPVRVGSSIREKYRLDAFGLSVRIAWSTAKRFQRSALPELSEKTCKNIR
jgi:hypothetical protein